MNSVEKMSSTASSRDKDSSDGNLIGDSKQAVNVQVNELSDRLNCFNIDKQGGQLKQFAPKLGRSHSDAPRQSQQQQQQQQPQQYLQPSQSQQPEQRRASEDPKKPAGESRSNSNVSLQERIIQFQEQRLSQNKSNPTSPTSDQHRSISLQISGSNGGSFLNNRASEPKLSPSYPPHYPPHYPPGAPGGTQNTQPDPTQHKFPNGVAPRHRDLPSGAAGGARSKVISSTFTNSYKSKSPSAANTASLSGLSSKSPVVPPALPSVFPHPGSTPEVPHYKPLPGGKSFGPLPPQTSLRGYGAVAGGGAVSGSRAPFGPSRGVNERTPKTEPIRRESKKKIIDEMINQGLFLDDDKSTAKSSMNDIFSNNGMGAASNSNSTVPCSDDDSSSPFGGSISNFNGCLDVENGSLTFTGKASVHSNGVEFSSGPSIKISTSDLKVLEELGRGNYGTVSKALHKPTGVTLAMKQVRLQLRDEQLRQILMELDILHKCNSPYIVDFFGAFFIEGAVYMCIEYMDGGSLDQVYNHGLDEKKVAYVTECVVRGLKELKDEHNIIHRDVKPTNILVNTLGKVKLCDFGVSGNLVASKAKTHIGCQPYMPPERIYSNMSDSSYTVQSDVWSLGISLVETATGVFPYKSTDSLFGQLNQIVNEEPPSFPNNFSASAKDFIKQCLHKNPGQRASYVELLEHPWLVENRKYQKEMEKELAEHVKSILREHEDTKEEEKEKNYNELLKNA